MVINITHRNKSKAAGAKNPDGKLLIFEKVELKNTLIKIEVIVDVFLAEGEWLCKFFCVSAIADAVVTRFVIGLTQNF